MFFRQVSVRRIAAGLSVLLTLVTVHVVAGVGHVIPGAQWAELCTPQGIQWVVHTEDLASTPDEDPAGLHGTLHCPLCRIAGDLAPDFGRTDLRFVVSPSARLPSVVPREIRPADPLALAPPPRAPPAALAPVL